MSPDPEVYKSRFLEDWSTLTTLRKPIIAAVSGYAVRSDSSSKLFRKDKTLIANSLAEVASWP
jgi:hypothetical protein